MATVGGGGHPSDFALACTAALSAASLASKACCMRPTCRLTWLIVSALPLGFWTISANSRPSKVSPPRCAWPALSVSSFGAWSSRAGTAEADIHCSMTRMRVSMVTAMFVNSALLWACCGGPGRTPDGSSGAGRLARSVPPPGPHLRCCCRTSRWCHRSFPTVRGGSCRHRSRRLHRYEIRGVTNSTKGPFR